MITMDCCFMKGDDLVTRCVAGETIIVPVRSGVGDLDSIYTLNEVSTAIWELIDGKTGVKTIIETVCNNYDVSYEEAEKDTVHFLYVLEQAGLVRRCGD
ncbi:MAG: PqqD family protein [Desulfobacterales bacterium]|nr:PqqD family protein [Desulfobacterales bacterium]